MKIVKTFKILKNLNNFCAVYLNCSEKTIWGEGGMSTN